MPTDSFLEGPRAGGNVSIDAAPKSPPDGYTIVKDMPLDRARSGGARV